MRTLAPGLHVAEQPQRYVGLEVGARMTVLELDEGLLVHSPVGVPPQSVAHLGEVRWVLAPNLLHHLYVGPWLEETDAESLCGAGLPEKRPDLRLDRVLTEAGELGSDEVLVVPTDSFAMTRELVLLHRPSRTLVVSDLVFHFTPEAPWLTRWGMWALGGYPGCRTTVLERWGMQRELARAEVSGLLELDFDRLVMAHGEVVETGGRDALAGAFSWLL